MAYNHKSFCQDPSWSRVWESNPHTAGLSLVSDLSKPVCSPPPEPFGHPGWLSGVASSIWFPFSLISFAESVNAGCLELHGNFGARAPLGQAPTHSMQSVHSGSLNFSQGRSSIRICIGQTSTQSPHFVHLEGSRFKPRKLNRMKIDMSAPVGQTYLHQNQGARYAPTSRITRRANPTSMRTPGEAGVEKSSSPDSAPDWTSLGTVANRVVSG